MDTIEGRFYAPLTLTSSYSFELQSHLAPGALAASDVDSWRQVNRMWKGGKQVWRDPANGDFFPRSKPNLVAIDKPRIGLYKSFVPAMDEGWTRWLLENFEFEYRNLNNPGATPGNLRGRYDVIVFPDPQANQITEGYRNREHAGAIRGRVGRSRGGKSEAVCRRRRDSGVPQSFDRLCA